MSYSHVARIYSYSFVNYLPEQDPATPNVIWPYKGDAHSYLGFYVSTVHPMRGDVQTAGHGSSARRPMRHGASRGRCR